MAEQQASNEDILSRRQSLIVIAALPIALLIAVHQRRESALVVQEFLSRCAASLAACRHLLDGRELEAVESVLPQYVPTLLTLAQQPSAYQKTAMEQVAQAYQLKSILALHRNNQKLRELYAQESVKYSHMAGEYNQYVAALEQLIGVYRASGRSTEALQTYQEILPSIGKIPPLLRSAVYVTQAWAYAHSGQEQEALMSLGLARETFPEHPEKDPSLRYVNFGLPRLHLWEGFTRQALHEHYPDRGHHQQAWNAFVHIGELRSHVDVPERIRLEAINHQAEAAIALLSLEDFCLCLEQGANGAKMLGSQKRRQEAVDAYWKGRGQWPNEPRVRDLADLFVN